MARYQMFDTAANFRDLGGHPTLSGRVVRRGLVYRSEALGGLRDAEVTALAALGLRVVCDLRSAHERTAVPHRLPPEWSGETLTTDADPRYADVGAFRNEVLLDAALAREKLMSTYSSFPALFAPMLRQIFVRVATADGPMLINCAAGKDRTGFVCAMLHTTLGVAPDTVMDDYLLSDRHFGAERIERLVTRMIGRAVPGGVVDALRVRPEYLEASFARISSDYGSVDRYLERAAGLTPELRKAVHTALIA
jgi:protein-tyrosine phosphatase